MTKNIKEPIPSLEFHITHRCNYNCWYCYEQEDREKSFNDATDNVVKKFLELLPNLEGKWLIKLIGGEPFIHPGFFEMAETIFKCGHDLSINTNFSFPLRYFERLVNLKSENFKECIASLHSNQCNPDIFIEKAISLNKMLHPNTKFVVVSIVTEENFEQLKDIAERLINNGVKFKFQNISVNSKRIVYSDKIENYLKSNKKAIVDETFNLKNFKSFGTICYTGYQSFYMTKEGIIKRCYTNQGPLQTLGSIEKGFKLFEQPMPCLSEHCTCSLPYERNMICFDKKNISFANDLMKAYNKNKISRKIGKVFSKIGKKLVYMPSKFLMREK